MCVCVCSSRGELRKKKNISERYVHSYACMFGGQASMVLYDWL